MSLYETAFSNLDHPLSLSESSGDLSVALDMMPARRHQVPHDWPSPLLRFMAPNQPSPRPSDKRAAPGRRTPPMAA